MPFTVTTDSTPITQLSKYEFAKFDAHDYFRRTYSEQRPGSTEIKFLNGMYIPYSKGTETTARDLNGVGTNGP
jgi:hypothetical protein